MNELALFAGGGGMLPGKLLGWRTVCYVEREPYAVEIIKARIRDGMLDDAPIWDDARTFDGYPWAGYVDIVTAGFPCQPWSTAGKQLGADDERNLWPDTLRVIREVRPRWVLLENVANLLSRLYIQQIFGDLAESGFDARWDCIPAAAVGAPHIRDRVWIVAHAGGGGCDWNERGRNAQQSTDGGEPVAHADRIGSQARVQLQEKSQPGWRCANVSNSNSQQHESGASQVERQATEIVSADANGERCNRGGCVQETAQPAGGLWSKRDCTWWAVEPDVGRVAHGVAARVDRIKAIGNGQVPAVARAAWNMLRGKEQ